MIDLEKIKRQVFSGEQIEDVVEKFDWQQFEKLVGNIFRQNDFVVKENFRFKNKKRFEIDLIAVRENSVFCVDCKQWSMGRNKKYAIKNSAIQQEERVSEFKKFLKKNFIAQKMLNVSLEKKFYPLIATLHEEEILEINKTLIVPLSKLNSFLVNEG